MTLEGYSAAPFEEESQPKRKYKRATIEDAKKWAEMYARRMSILKIAEIENVAPSTVSKWLRTVGIEIKQGQHFVEQPPLKYSRLFLDLLMEGPEAVQERLRKAVWGIQFSEEGLKQLEKFCSFVRMHRQGLGVKEIGRKLELHRSSVAEWREGTDQPYLIKVANQVISRNLAEGWMLVPFSIESGGNSPMSWTEVPSQIRNYSDLIRIVDQLDPLPETFRRASEFCIPSDILHSMKIELFAYLLGIMLGDAGKPGGVQERFTSMNLDLQLSQKEISNERLGGFVCLCANALGIRMERTEDKQPSGTTVNAELPFPAYRWMSARSPLIAWIFNVCLGLKMTECTSVNEVSMDWVFSTPSNFLKRFVQGLADSDGTVRNYLVEIASMPNAEFVTRVLTTLGLRSARTMLEEGKPTRSSVLTLEAASLPVFNEFVKGYRYELLMRRAEFLRRRTTRDLRGEVG